MARAAAALAALLLSCTPASTLPEHAAPKAITPPPAPRVEIGVSRQPTTAEAKVIRQLMNRTEQLRGLSFRAPVSVRIQDKTAVRAYVKSALDEVELRKARRRYVALGLIDPSIDVRELIESLMEEELIGYYDPKQKMLAVREEVATSLANARDSAEDEQWKATVVHELVHALQDQHLGLSEAMNAQRTTDEENAFGAVVEGDATLAMLGYMAARQGSSLAAVVSAPDQLAIALRSGRVHPEGKLANAPPIVREPLLFRYRDGALFAAYLYARGGWEQVDEAHRITPKSTLAIREPRRFLEQQRDPSLPAPPDLMQHGCQQIDDDVLGGLEISVSLGEDSRAADAFARAWRGDRYVVLQCGSNDASVWLLRFTSAQLAQRARAAFERLDRESNHTRHIVAHGAHLLVALGTPPSAVPELASALRRLVTP